MVLRKSGLPVLCDLAAYAENNPDVKAAYGEDYTAIARHYITYGIKEGRSSSGLLKKAVTAASLSLGSSGSAGGGNGGSGSAGGVSGGSSPAGGASGGSGSAGSIPGGNESAGSMSGINGSAGGISRPLPVRRTVIRITGVRGWWRSGTVTAA